MDIRVIQDKIKRSKSLILYEPEELKYLDKSTIAKTMYKQSQPNSAPMTPSNNYEEEENDDTIPYWKQRVTCDVCGKKYSRSGVSKHRGTQFHKTHEKINAKLREFILE